MKDSHMSKRNSKQRKCHLVIEIVENFRIRVTSNSLYMNSSWQAKTGLNPAHYWIGRERNSQ